MIPKLARGWEALRRRGLDHVLWGLLMLGVLFWGLGERFFETTRVRQLPPLTAVPVEMADVVVEVRGTDGGPLANARASLLLADAKERFAEVGTAVSDARGLGHFDAVPQGRGWLLVDADGFARRSRPVLLFGQHHFVVTLAPASGLAVTVADEDGRPIEGATVLVRDADALPFGALTSADGARRFDRLSPAPWTVEVFARGYESQRREGISGDQHFVLRKLGSLLVHVLDTDGSPAREAQVFVVGSTLWPARRALTDEAGKVTLSGLMPGVYNLKAQLGSKTSPELSGVALERAEHKRVELRLRAGRTLRVKVVDDSPGYDEPVVGAQVTLAEYGISSFPVSATSGEDGLAFLSPVPATAAYVSVNAEGFVPRSAVPVPWEGDAVLRIALLRGATLRGEVTDPEGRPIDGARVEVIGTDTDGLPIAASPLLDVYRDAHFRSSLEPLPLEPAGELGVTLGPVPFVSEALTGQAWTQLPTDYRPWLTDFEGDFVAFPVPPGRVRALVRHPAYVEGLSEAVVLGPGGEAKVTVVLSPGGSLIGRVVDSSGRPVPLSRVTVTAVRGSFERSAYAADDGTFTFSAVPGEVTVQLARPEDPSRYVEKRTVRIKSGATLELELVLPEPRDPIEVEIEDGERRALELAQVQFTSLDAAVPLRATRFSDAEGRVTLEDAAGLRLRIVVSAPGHLTYSEQFERAPAELRVVLQKGVLVEGRITAVRGRQELQGARVTLQSGAHRESTTTDGFGHYEFRNIPAGAVSVTVSHPDYATARRSLVVERTARDDRPFEIADIDLAEGATLAGVVRDPLGNGVRGARVGLGFAPAVMVQGQLPEGFVLSDAAGRFELHQVEPGEHRLSAYADGVGRGSLDVAVEDDRDQLDLELTLDEPTDESGTNLQGGGVALTLGERDEDGETRVVIVHLAPGGEAERAGLEPGDVIVSVDGKRARDMRATRAQLNGRVGVDVVIGIERDGRRASYRVRREPTGR